MLWSMMLTGLGVFLYFMLMVHFLYQQIGQLTASVVWFAGRGRLRGVVGGALTLSL